MDMKIVVLDKPRENEGEIDWSEVEKLGDARIYDDTPQEKIAQTIADPAKIAAAQETSFLKNLFCRALNAE